MKVKRKICVVTTSRADYGALYWLLKEIAADSQLELELLVSGMHLSRKHGYTAAQIISEFPQAQTVPMLGAGDSALENSGAVASGFTAFAKRFAASKPDILVLLGDRFELLAPAGAALLARIPIAHIHGGETTEGAIDEAVRHSITKMALWHFPAAEPYRKRIMQLGEDPKRIFCFGAPGLDHLKRQRLLSKRQLEKELGFSLESPVAVITFHPATLEQRAPERQVREMLSALKRSGVRAIFTKANIDTGGGVINEICEAFCRRSPSRHRLFDNLGTRLYFSCLKNADLMIGNSSSGIVEAPSFKLPVVNVGDRQLGRARSRNIIDVPCNTLAIEKAIKKALSPQFKRSLAGMRSVYSARNGGTAKAIKEKLKEAPLSPKVLKKKFFDLDLP